MVQKRVVMRLKVVLAQKGIQQKELAEIAGMENYQISQLCKEKKPNITLGTAKRIADALGVTLDEVFGDY
jgi:DNA-binding Xre family transcriptional regulator